MHYATFYVNIYVYFCLTARLGVATYKPYAFIKERVIIMLLILIGIIIGAFIFYLGMKMEQEDVAFCGFALAILAIIISLTYPTAYKEEELVEEIRLVSLQNSISESGNGIFYVSISAENVYSYRYKVSSEFGTETSTEYKLKKLSKSDGDILESEDPNCKEPVLIVYKAKHKVSLWTLGVLGPNKYTYVFYVPEGTIQKDAKLN